MCVIFVLDLIKVSHLLENKHVWIQIGWKLMNLNLIFLKVTIFNMNLSTYTKMSHYTAVAKCQS